MSERPWYRRFPDRFIAGTVRLTLEEKGAYSLVLDLMYVRGGPIADEPRYIAGVCNCSVRKWNAIRQRLIDLGKIELVDGCLVNRRAEEELEISAKTAEERAESGRKGGEKTAEKSDIVSESSDLGKAELKHTRASLPLHPYRKKEASSTSKEVGAGAPKMDDRVRLHRDDPAFREIGRVRGLAAEPYPPSDREGCWTFPSSEVEAARSSLAKRKAAAA